jgi:hypothetical protein
LNLFKSKLNPQLSKYLPGKKDDNMDLKGMAKQISNQLSQLRSNFLFKASRMQGLSRVNLNRQKTSNSSEVNFAKYKKKPSDFSSNNMVKKTSFSKGANQMANQSSKIYSYDSIPDIEHRSNLKKLSMQKTNEILQEIEDIENTPKELKMTEDHKKNRSPKKQFFGKVSVFTCLKKRPTRKLQPVYFDDDESFNGFD